MGSRMVKHLLDAGNSVVVYDSNQVSWRRSNRRPFLPAGGKLQAACVFLLPGRKADRGRAARQRAGQAEAEQGGRTWPLDPAPTSPHVNDVLPGCVCC